MAIFLLVSRVHCFYNYHSTLLSSPTHTHTLFQLYSDVEVGMSQLENYLEEEAAETVNETQVVYLTTVILDIFGEAPVSRNLSQVGGICV